MGWDGSKWKGRKGRGDRVYLYCTVQEGTRAGRYVCDPLHARISPPFAAQYIQVLEYSTAVKPSCDPLNLGPLE